MSEHAEILKLIENDSFIKVAGIDVDGILRGKIISKAKFLSILKTDGFGFCSVIFGWDMHDKTYPKELAISNLENGYRDIIAKPDLSTFRRIPWETYQNLSPESVSKSSVSQDPTPQRQSIPFLLVSFTDPDTEKPISPDPRSLLKSVLARIKKNDDIKGIAFSGMEFEFFQYKETHDSLYAKNGLDLTPLTPGMFGYSIARLGLNNEYQQEMLETCAKFKVDLEGWHTETGPGVFETAIGYCESLELADKATLFKLVAKTVGSKYGIMPCFMAKPKQGLPGNSGHIHVSLMSEDGSVNLFARETPDENCKWEDIKYLSDLGRQFLAGVLAGMPYIMPLFAPTINSYKRLVENFWAPVTVSWGYEHRIASIRLIAPPAGSAKATRFEIRTPGADVQPHLALAAIYALGLRGIEKKMELTVPPMGTRSPDEFERLPKNLRSATEKFMSKESLAREVLGDEFVEHYGETRLHECREWEDAVTNWEVTRYMETI